MGQDWQIGEDQGAHAALLACLIPHCSFSLTQPQWKASPGVMCSPGGCLLLALPAAHGAPRKDGRLAIEPFAHSPQIGREQSIAVQK